MLAPAPFVTGVLATAVGFLIQTLAQKHLPAVRTPMVLTMEPQSATFFGYLLAGDRLGAVQMDGAGSAVAAVLPAEVGPTPDQAQPAGSRLSGI
ncbi:MAG TPA: hypothetical protein EYH34_18655 [Planctomycetes bacterium]|nr:hypothetical protein [Planctomycetota bacterium]